MRMKIWYFLLAGVGSLTILTGWQMLRTRDEAQYEHEPLVDGRVIDESVASLLRATSKDGEIILLAATRGYVDFAANAICRMQQLSISHYFILALDDETKYFFDKRNVSVVRSTSLGMKRRYGFIANSLYSRDFNFIAREKHAGALACLILGLKVLLLDVDVFLLQNPLQKLHDESLGYDFVFQSDAKMDDPPNFYVNSGLYYAKPTQAAKDTLVQLLNYTYSGHNQEQTVLHHLVCGVGNALATDSEHCYNKNTGCQSIVLDRKLFVHGHTLTRNTTATKVLLWNPLTIHFNWLEGRQNKIIVMKALNMWILSVSNECFREYRVQDSVDVAEEFDKNLSVS